MQILYSHAFIYVTRKGKGPQTIYHFSSLELSFLFCRKFLRKNSSGLLGKAFCLTLLLDFQAYILRAEVDKKFDIGRIKV
jgi:hypothetical protein